ncbi:MAG: alpha/beta hydrolase [Pegethrix bostrychoides GSE-TBD4-15B]|jgi:pimeloyl-ACP methyl ester carboxylesterase|uniref:Alpha/beta hydrolase n=1 Tax=Pegethrix bostrychoides GSE-TBD4-15B TaxID=2839662 RepID=A0A951PDR0_9CYAN|nr:alpha/beta hydrolase [Pegethrix bostrychoides GSE-TBD4-15B]
MPDSQIDSCVNSQACSESGSQTDSQLDPLVQKAAQTTAAIADHLEEQPLPGSQADLADQIEKSLKDIYLVSGLGADERVFQMLKLEGYRPVHVRWLKPERGESLADYAQRLTAQIPAAEPVLVGLSFGGIVAVEIAKQIAVKQVVLISSVKDRSEVPFYFKLFRWLPIHRILPFKSLLWAGYLIAYWLFSIECLEERRLLKSILLDTDPHFLKWALHRVVIWDNEVHPAHLHQIHGSSDRIFPIRYIDPEFVLEGGHLMVVNRASQVSTLIERIVG